MSLAKPGHSRNSLTILLIALISIVPFAAAWYFAKNPQLVENRNKSNYGHLIIPARPIEYGELLRNPVSAAENLTEIKGRWTMIILTSQSSCDKVCQETAEKTGRVRLMLNKEITRVRRLLLFDGHVDEPSVKELAGRDPTLIMASMSDSLRRIVQDALGSPPAEGSVLLLDPFANLMMWYQPGFDPYGLLRDLQRLLRISQIG